MTHARRVVRAGHTIVTEGAQRICSLLPSATEIVCALDVGERLVGVTHECDYPPHIDSVPRITSSVIPTDSLSAREIDDAVRDALAEQATIYRLDRDRLETLHPDLILTQELCDVCAVGPDEVRRVVSQLTDPPDIVSLEPHSLDEVLDSILLVGVLTGARDRALSLVRELRARMDVVRRAVISRERPRVLTLEWVDPPFVGGHWVPEMVEIAGGVDVLGSAGKPSREVSWDEAVGSRPDVVAVMLCGFDLERSKAEMARAQLPPQWHELPAVKDGRVYVTDGSSYFSRPGPRLVDGVEILGTLLHPDAFAQAPERSLTYLL